MPPQDHALCPGCRQRAPIVLRGLGARCAVCGARRIPFAAAALNVTGKPATIGGAAARFFGWTTVAVGIAMATFLGLLLHSVWPASMIAYAISVPILILSLFFGGLLVLGGRKLGRHGKSAQRVAQADTVRALAAHQGGALTAPQAARALGLPEPEADAMLTALAKTPHENVTLDLDDDGTIFYLFGLDDHALEAGRWRFAAPRPDHQNEPSTADNSAETSLPTSPKRHRS